MKIIKLVAENVKRIEAVEIDRDIQRPLEHRDRIGSETRHGDNLDAEPACLLAQVAVERANADLHQPLGMTGLAGRGSRKALSARSAPPWGTST